MRHQKNKKRKSKKRKNNLTDEPVEYKHYQPNNHLTMYFSKLIDKNKS
tara:strand:+ start:2137 stop:2280 length:144 start_codon:yes stop_codon:yes gene_type:complete